MLRQCAVQGAAVILVLSLAWPYFGLRSEPLPWPETAFGIGAVALLLARLSHQPSWWLWIHALFVPAAWAVSRLDIPPGWFLLGFIALLLFFRGAASGRIPLYLSNAATVETLSDLLRQHPGVRFVDLGAGIASTLVPLAQALPDKHFTGVENAPASWAIGRIRTRGIANILWQHANLWDQSLGDYDGVYAFLSPAPMAALWQKALREMKPGSILVSNSFAIPDVSPTEIIQVDDTRQTQLYCYRIP
ncbi:class I SAM-dependent methyltransferase [Propionivibrio dicarboxylicus]|nr:class I SAM-dependent methyltransferase [Propionivibrio dicarboxylicus]